VRRRKGLGANLLHERREPGHERERITAVSIGDSVDGIDSGLLVESEVDPADEPSELDKDPRVLEADDA
jgi:hypothetical protein